MNFEPNLALDLEIADLINSKKGNAYGQNNTNFETRLISGKTERSCDSNRQLRQQPQPQCLSPRPHGMPPITVCRRLQLTRQQLLDICVKNCGYPFHLQISTKEFLNELVRRFPERPPIRPSRVQQRVLELIEEWRQTICQTSRYKEDLGFIRDMHRLLSFKGYLFPEVRREDAAVLNPSDVGSLSDQ